VSKVFAEGIAPLSRMRVASWDFEPYGKRFRASEKENAERRRLPPAFGAFSVRLPPSMPPQDIQLHRLIPRERVVDLRATTKREALRELADLLAGDPNVTDLRAFLGAIYKREELVSTGVGLGVAIPHVKIPEVRDYVFAVGRKVEGIEFDSLDGQPVRLVFMIGASDKQTRDFVKMLARVMRLLKNGATRVKLLEAALPDEFLDILRKDDLGES